MMTTFSNPHGNLLDLPISHRPELPKLLAHALQLFRDLAGKWAKRRRYHETVTELRRCSDHELDDIGISRGQIELIAHQSTYGQG